MTNSELDSVMRRIAKLLAIAGDDRANPAEASAAAGMAERIMRKYQIEHADVVMTQLKAGNDMSTQDVLCTAKTNGTKVVQVPPWCGFLAVGVAKLNEVSAVIARNAKGEAVVQFRGFRSDVMVASYMLDYLVATTNRLCKEFLKTAEYEVGGRPAVNSYRHGVTTGMLANLRIQHQEKSKELNTSATGSALVVAKAHAVAEHFGAMRTKPTASSVRRGDNFSSGVRDGKAVDVNRRGIGSSGGSSTLMIGR